jgi:hypothetical protein
MRYGLTLVRRRPRCCPSEWGSMAGHSMMGFRRDKPWLMVGLVLEQLDQQHRGGIVAGMPPDMRTMWREQFLQEPADRSV